MRFFRIKTSIIGVLPLLTVLLTLLGGCSSVRLGYDNGPQLLWWWLDGYVDFRREQAPPVKRGLESLFEWHRATQLPAYTALLGAAAAQITEPTTAERACRWQAEVRDLLEPTLQRGLVLAAAQTAALDERNFRHVEQRYAKGDEEMREDFLQPDPAERRRQSVKRAVERAERLYGRLDETQLRVIRDGVAASPFDPALWLQERQRRQRELLDTLRRLAAEKPQADQRIAALRALLAHAERSPNPAYRDYQARLGEYNCAFAARIHNATTPAQRGKAREALQGWEEDLRALAAPPS